MNTLLWLSLWLAGPNLLPNGGCEELTDGWPSGWSRGWCRAGAAELTVSLAERAHSGQRALRVQHRGAQDWSLNPGPRLPAVAGDFFELTAWVLPADSGEIVLCATLWPPTGDSGVQWAAGAVSARGPRTAWVQLRTRLLVPAGLTFVEPRVIGTGPTDVLVDELTCVRLGNVADYQTAFQGAALARLRSRGVQLELTPQTQTWTVTDPRSGRTWTAPGSPGLVPQQLARTAEGVELTTFDPLNESRLALRVSLQDSPPATR
ncbi:MAG: hypothetical protein IT204_05595 [Fimbriimonadaceae bacterium]|nr:hypothetical protein [Fimbriimonadaceae bacterium]